MVLKLSNMPVLIGLGIVIRMGGDFRLRGKAIERALLGEAKNPNVEPDPKWTTG